MAFNPLPAARPVLDLGLLRLTVPDDVIYVLHPRPYLARCGWAEEAAPEKASGLLP
jgi:hypothetical protein